ncbi:Golgi reassembly-stacking protein 2 [Atheta coriaria]|uniref:Golgi reassembly-stacking protein 2 n=1 Tax=Dalotia coriaria TaxID=877792 RepID=UPI0031F3DE3E
MGNASSVDIPGGGTEGYHVLKVQDNSPGSSAGLVSFFDFIIAINGTRLDQDNDTFKQILRNGIGKQLPLTVYSSKSQSVRSILIEPSDSWGGAGLLGVSIRFCSFEGANENVWHILEVHPSSPAELAGLQSFSDYIIGAESVLHENEDLFALIEAHEGRCLKLYVYNSNDDSCREVTITPNSSWGGEGSIGCGIGYGYLHRIPVRFDDTPAPAAKYPDVPAEPASNVINAPLLPPQTQTITPTFKQPISSAPAQVDNIAELTTQMSDNLNLNGNNTTTTPDVGVPLIDVGVTSIAPPTSVVNNNMEAFTYAPSIPNIAPFYSTVSTVPAMPVVENSHYPSATPTNYNAPPVLPPPTAVQQQQLQQQHAYNYPPPSSLPYSMPTMPLQNQYANATPIAPMYTAPTYPQNTAVYPPTTGAYHPQTFVYDPDIAAKSAQQLLAGNTEFRTN